VSITVHQGHYKAKSTFKKVQRFPRDDTSVSYYTIMRKNIQGLNIRTETRPLVSAKRTAKPNVVLRVRNQVFYIIEIANYSLEL